MGNDYYRKHKNDRHVALSSRDRLILRTLLSLEINFAEQAERKNIEPAFSVKHMKALYEKVCGWNYDETHREE